MIVNEYDLYLLEVAGLEPTQVFISAYTKQ